eukprot:5054428-Amphidinium_carterae.1
MAADAVHGVLNRSQDQWRPPDVVERKPLQSRLTSFSGNLIVVDVSTIRNRDEDFEGREWLEKRTKEGLSLGWDLEWVPDRKGENNPIALMQLSDDATCLLLRTHRSGSWLPSSVWHCLESEDCKKICVGYDANDRKKMKSSFGVEANGVVDLVHLSRQKGIGEYGLKGLAQYFDLHMKKDPKMSTSNWAAASLSPDQCRYAAEDAYFCYLLIGKIQAMPDVAAPTNRVSSQCNVLEIQLPESWVKEGIVRKHDGVHCEL